MNKIKLFLMTFLSIIALGAFNTFNAFGANTVTTDGGVWCFTNKIYILLVPTEPTQVVNKAYVDDLAKDYVASIYIADPTNLPPYNLIAFPYPGTNVTLTRVNGWAYEGSVVFDLVECSTNSRAIEATNHTGITIGTVGVPITIFQTNITANGSTWALYFTNAVGATGVWINVEGWY